ncbi:dehydrogenase/reductase SDR family member on chromosome X-like [Lineus longissimus]|uniref:dehydrogenase/reductase SDR family member on chromosome X-like n=1 Tax=Lineus longissimus TaxID=88925 RepID=UPI002B4D06B5
MFHICHVLWNFLKLYSIAVITLIQELLSKHRRFNRLDFSDGHNCDMVAIVTGGAKGIGYEITRELIQQGIHVIIGSHSQEESDRALQNIKKDFPDAKVEYLYLDLASLSSVQQFVESFKKKNLPLHILINNAGVMLCPYHVTEDSFESQFGINYIGHFLLTHLLLDILKKSGTSSRYSRIVNTSSVVHFVGKIQFENLQGRLSYSSHASYSQSKLAIVLFTYELQRRLTEEGCYVTTNALHPGVVNTDLYRHVHPSIRGLLLLMARYLLKTPRQGADTSLYAALSEDLEGRGGLYLDNCRPVKSANDTYNIQLQRELWFLSLHLTHIDPTD